MTTFILAVLVVAFMRWAEESNEPDQWEALLRTAIYTTTFTVLLAVARFITHLF